MGNLPSPQKFLSVKRMPKGDEIGSPMRKFWGKSERTGGPSRIADTVEITELQRLVITHAMHWLEFQTAKRRKVCTLIEAGY